MRVGVIGSFVWDIIYGRDPRRDPVEEWGGITYALSAFDAALPESWQVVPLAKVDMPKEGGFEPWKSELLMKLRRRTFHHFPERIPAARAIDAPEGPGGEPGDLYVVVNVQLPQQLNDEDRGLWEKLGKVSRFNPRQPA